MLFAAMPEAPLLRTEALTRAFGSLIAVDRVDVTVRRGELRSIIGPNGAGKTTFFRLISGETVPTSGRVWFGERDITGLPQHAVARLGITKSYQITNVFPHLSAHETMRLIRELTAGRTVILVEHKMKVVMKISDRVTVLHQGQVLAEGTPEEIRANERVQQTYLGVIR